MKHRREGQYYRRAWESAIDSSASWVSITSYNEFGEGTQIEPVLQGKKGYKDYGGSPMLYMKLTKEFADVFKRQFEAQEDL